MRVGSTYELYVDRDNAIRVTMNSGAQPHARQGVAADGRVHRRGARCHRRGADDARPPGLHHGGASGDAARRREPDAAPERGDARSAVVPRGWFTSANANAKKEFEKNLAVTAATLDNIATGYANIQVANPALADQVAQNLGVNRYAAPNVGEAYETFRVGVGTPAQTTNVAGAVTRHFWGQHVGGVVAVSG